MLGPRIPLVDLVEHHRALMPEITAAICTVVDEGSFIGGPHVREFESQFAAFTQRSLCVGVANGTDAIYLALRAAGIGPGDEVIVPVNTFIATAEAVSLTGARPVFVEIDEATQQADVTAVRDAHTNRTAAVVPVHLFGHPCRIDEITAWADQHGLFVCEDAAQAHGAAWCGQAIGTFGDVAAFSFYPGKNLGALGDGGAITTDDESLAERIRRLANHGSLAHKYLHECEGVNSRLDAIQAAVLSVKLRHLPRWNELRRQAAARYRSALADTDLVLPPIVEGALPVYHLFVVRVRNRDAVRDHLLRDGIEAGVHYPMPLNKQPAYAGVCDASFPVAERVADEILSLPMFPELTEEQISRVADSLRSAIASAGRA